MISTEKKSDSAMWNSAALIFCGGVHSSRATGEQLLYFLTGHISMTLLATVALLTLKRMPHTIPSFPSSVCGSRLVGLPVKTSGSRAAEPRFYSRFLRWVFFSGSSHTRDRGRNSSVGSAWARCSQRRGFDPPLGTFSVEGIFPLELTWVQTPFPPKLLRMRV